LLLFVLLYRSRAPGSRRRLRVPGPAGLRPWAPPRTGGGSPV